MLTNMENDKPDTTMNQYLFSYSYNKYFDASGPRYYNSLMIVAKTLEEAFEKLKNNSIGYHLMVEKTFIEYANKSNT